MGLDLRCLGERKVFPFAEASGYDSWPKTCSSARWEEAIGYARKDQEIGERVGSLDRVAWAWFPHSACLFGQGRLQEARQMAESRLVIAEQTGDHRLVAWFQGVLGMILSDLGETEAAHESARRSLEGSDRLQQVIMQCWSRSALVYQMLKDKDWGRWNTAARRSVIHADGKPGLARLYWPTLYECAAGRRSRKRRAVHLGFLPQWKKRRPAFIRP
jgi:hypothetical protein